MGNFYINIAVKGVPVAVLEKKLAVLPYRSIITPEIEGHVFVYGDFFGAGDMQAPAELAKSLSEEAGADYAMFSMNADDDLLVYEVWSGGERIDAYFSEPEMFEPDGKDTEAPRGDPERLKRIFPFLDEQEARRLLESGDYVFAVQRHQDLCRLLHIPAGPAVMDFQYIQNGEAPEGVEASSLIRIEP